MPTINELESISIPAGDSVIVVTDPVSSKKITVNDLKSHFVKVATGTTVGAIKVGQGLNITGDGVLSVSNYSDYILPPASNTRLGGVIAGNGLSVDQNGVLSVASMNIPPATSSTYGLVKIGANLTVVEGALTAPAPYSLPEASPTVLGGVRVGDGLTVENGVLSTAGNFFVTESGQVITEDYTTTNGTVSYSVGPITIDRNVTFTVNRSSTWVIYDPESLANPTPPPAPVPIQEQDTVITANYSIANNKIATSFGPITVDRNVTVEIAPLSTWIII